MAKLAPSVEKPRPLVRPAVWAALVAGLAIAIAIPIATHVKQAEPDAVDPDAELRAHCTPLGATLYLHDAALPVEEHAICLAIAGKIDAARMALLAMMPAHRSAAIERIFAIAHPIADAGDDRSAGPIMGLVVELWPENYMAMFHVGMAEYAIGHDAEAASYLERFRAMYSPRDVWRQRADAALAGLAAHLPLARRDAHFAE